MKNFIIIDDHVMVRNGVCSFLQASTNCKIISSGDTAEKIFSEIKDSGDFEEAKTCAIVDVNLKEGDGFKFVVMAKQLYPNMKFIMYSMYSNFGHIENAKTAGADGYVAKDASEKELLTAIDKVFSGEKYFPDLDKIPNSIKNNTFGMTKKEQAVFEKILKNKDNNEIAEEMELSIGTVQNYTSRIYDKTNCKNRSKLLKEFGGKME